MKFTTLLWIPNRLPNERPGFIGRLLDIFWPRFIEIPDGAMFIATREDGVIFRSSDGCTWTVQSTPPDE